MQKNRRTKLFKEMLGRLPDEIRRQATAAFRAFVNDPANKALCHHKLKNTSKGKHRNDSYSVSIDMQYRAIYVIDGDTNVWYWIGTHSDYNKFTGS